MAWQITQTYAAATDRIIDALRRSGRSYCHLTRPAVTSDLIAAIASTVPTGEQREYAMWRETAGVLEPERVLQQLPSDAEVYGCFPDVEWLLWLKWLAMDTDSPVAISSCETFGGQIEYEWAWEFGARERAIIRAEFASAVEEPYRDWLCRRRLRRTTRLSYRVYEVTHAGIEEREVEHLYVLKAIMMSLGNPLDTTGYFRPHERLFPWEHFRIRPPIPRTP